MLFEYQLKVFERYLFAFSWEWVNYILCRNSLGAIHIERTENSVNPLISQETLSVDGGSYEFGVIYTTVPSEVYLGNDILYLFVWKAHIGLLEGLRKLLEF